MTRTCLACTVRGCGQRLERRERAWVCPRGHSHDIARRGYLNLLQPQDRRSRAAGDAKKAVQARARLLDAGIGRMLLEQMAARAASVLRGRSPVVVDLGAGSGHALAAIAGRASITGIGIDLSAAAAEQAARRFPALTWIVANADRRLPLEDHCVDLVLSLHGRRNPDECARVLTRGGFLLVVVPAADDLVELRTYLRGRPDHRDRVGALVNEHERAFRLTERFAVRERHHLLPDALRDVLRATYRGRRWSEAARVDALEPLDVTLASECCLFALK